MGNMTSLRSETYHCLRGRDEGPELRQTWPGDTVEILLSSDQGYLRSPQVLGTVLNSINFYLLNTFIPIINTFDLFFSSSDSPDCSISLSPISYRV